MAENIKKAGYVNPTPIQKSVISVILAKRDLIACAFTGSGKTVRFEFFLVVVHNLVVLSLTS
jgi:ATP-dependent RNA helicase DDX3X